MRGRRWIGALSAAAVLAGLAGCGDDDPEGDLAGFCTLATEQARMADLLDELDPDDVSAALTTFRTVREAQDRLRDLAPEAARPDVETVRSFVDDVIEGLEEADPEASGPPPVYAELRPRFDEVEAASRRLTTYVDSNCG